MMKWILGGIIKTYLSSGNSVKHLAFTEAMYPALHHVRRPAAMPASWLECARVPPRFILEADRDSCNFVNEGTSTTVRLAEMNPLAKMLRLLRPVSRHC
jgi:hypothetical protein